MGPSGSGKTTLLNLLAGLDRLDGGELWLQGENMGSLRAGVHLACFAAYFWISRVNYLRRMQFYAAVKTSRPVLAS